MTKSFMKVVWLAWLIFSDDNSSAKLAMTHLNPIHPGEGGGIPPPPPSLKRE